MRSSLLRLPSIILLGIVIGCAGATGCSRDKGGTKGADSAAAIDTAALLSDEIAATSRLATGEYHVRKIIVYDDRIWLKGSIFSHQFNEALPIGERKAAIPVDVVIRASVDFSGFSSRNIRRSGRKITITLPDPDLEVASSRIDRRNIHFAVAPLRSRYSESEIEALTRQGVDSIKRDLPRLGIVESARLSAADFLIPLVERMGYERSDITINFRPAVSDRTILHWSNVSDLLRQSI